MKIGIIVMASGLSKRFGSNKLLTEFRGRSLIELVLDKTEKLQIDGHEDVEFKRLVLTRTQEVQSICDAKGVLAFLHELPERNEAVRLGMDSMSDCDACLFVTCDQPLLQKSSIEAVIGHFLESNSGICRLSHEDKVGNPIIFSSKYFEELKALPDKKGGSYVASNHPDEVSLVKANNQWELFDVDTKEDLELLVNVTE